MFWRIGKWVVVAAAIAGLGFMAFAPHDHKVELVVTYEKSPPSAVWRLLTDHAAEPTWLSAFGAVARQADAVEHEAAGAVDRRPLGGSPSRPLG